MWLRFLVTLAVAAMIEGAQQAPIPVSTGTSVSSGVYTAAQAKRGESVYLNTCSHCHLYDLSGGRDPDGVGDSPPLAGDRFLEDWAGETVATLFDDVRWRMPYDNPGKLTAQECADVLAYVFSVNKFPPGDRELTTDATLLKQIRITRNP
jgi:cytochrome c